MLKWYIAGYTLGAQNTRQAVYFHKPLKVHSYTVQVWPHEITLHGFDFEQKIKLSRYSVLQQGRIHCTEICNNGLAHSCTVVIDMRT